MGLDVIDQLLESSAGMLMDVLPHGMTGSLEGRPVAALGVASLRKGGVSFIQSLLELLARPLGRRGIEPLADLEAARLPSSSRPDVILLPITRQVK